MRRASASCSGSRAGRRRTPCFAPGKFETVTERVEPWMPAAAVGRQRHIGARGTILICRVRYLDRGHILKLQRLAERQARSGVTNSTRNAQAPGAHSCVIDLARATANAPQIDRPRPPQHKAADQLPLTRGPRAPHHNTSCMGADAATVTPPRESMGGATEEDLADGFSLQEVFGGSKAHSGYTYDDIIVLPGEIDFGVESVTLESKVTRKISLRTPFVSSPMDTVTEATMAIGMAQHGGLGIIHYNMPIEDQVVEVRKVKTYKNGFISDPVRISA